MMNPKMDEVRIVPVTYGVGRESPPTLVGRALDWMSIICPGIAADLAKLAIPYTRELGHQDRFAAGLVRFPGLSEVRLVTNHLPATPNLSKTPGLRRMLDVKMGYVEGPRMVGEGRWEKAVDELRIAMKKRIGGGRVEDGMKEEMVDGIEFVLCQLQPEIKK